MNEALSIRRRTDLEKLRGIQAKAPGLLEILRVTGDPPQSVSIRFRIPTVKNRHFPQERQEISEVEILFSERHPLPPGPIARFKTPIWNPNVYPSGQWCYKDWVVTEYLDLFVLRLMRVIALDPQIINPQSAANGDAARWYVQMKERCPELFPTAPISIMMAESDKPKIAWRTIK